MFIIAWATNRVSNKTKTILQIAHSSTKSRVEAILEILTTFKRNTPKKRVKVALKYSHKTTRYRSPIK